MAKRKSKGNDAAVPQSGNSSSRISTDIEGAENGFIVRCSNEGKNGYESKRYVAFTRPQALALAAEALSGKKKGGKKKARKSKAFISKKS